MRDPYDHARERFDLYAGLAPPAQPLDRLSALQVRLARWQNRQFPGSTIEDAALGIGEELGELAEAFLGMATSAGRVAHAVLKDKQKIRGFGSPDALRRAVADAVADLAIFSMQVCTFCRLDFGAVVEATAECVLARQWQST